MIAKWMQTAFLLIGWMAMSSAVADAQTDISASLYGAFAGTTTGNGVTQSPSNAAGFLLEVRHIAKPWLGFEGTYAYNRANQAYSSFYYPCGTVCNVVGIESEAVLNNAHEVTGDWIASVKVRNLRPFALAGGGILFDVPSGQSLSFSCVGTCLPVDVVNNTNNIVKPVFVYGGGLDWGLLPHFGLRFQYRGNLYKAPALTSAFTSTGAFLHTAEPMIGGYFQF